MDISKFIAIKPHERMRQDSSFPTRHGQSQDKAEEKINVHC